MIYYRELNIDEITIDLFHAFEIRQIGRASCRERV